MALSVSDLFALCSWDVLVPHLQDCRRAPHFQRTVHATEIYICSFDQTYLNISNTSDMHLGGAQIGH